MKLILAAAFLVVAYASVTVAQEQFICTAPPVWYSHFTEVNPSLREERRGRYYYDEDNMRVAIREEAIEGFNNISYYWDIFNHKTNMGYRIINETLKECQRFTLRGEFPTIGPYLSEKFQGEYTIGSSARPKDGVQVVIYSGYNDRGDDFYGVWIPVGNNTCLPVSESFTIRADKSFHNRRYYDIRMGIFDYSVFEPPSYC